ncbi:hypothetical protein PENTCL1PPCAC_3493, partial [Pristionchus entomophagus]
LGLSHWSRNNVTVNRSRLHTSRNSFTTRTSRSRTLGIIRCFTCSFPNIRFLQLRVRCVTVSIVQLNILSLVIVFQFHSIAAKL